MGTSAFQQQDEAIDISGMLVSFRPYTNDQLELFPVRPRDWLDEDHTLFYGQ